MFSKDNLPPILSRIGEEYLMCNIVRDFGKVRLNGIFKIDEEVGKLYGLKDDDGAGRKQLEILGYFERDIGGENYEWRSSEHEIEHWIDKTNYYLEFCRHNQSDSVLSFGKYNGRTVGWIIENDFDYIKYCMRTVDRFFLKGEYLIELCNSGYIFNAETITAYTVKRAEYIAHIKVHNAAVMAQEAINSPYLNYDSDDNGWGGNPSSNPYYDDDLDMDQQSQEFWDNL